MVPRKLKKLDALDLIIAALKDHEKKLDSLINELNRLIVILEKDVPVLLSTENDPKSRRENIPTDLTRI